VDVDSYIAKYRPEWERLEAASARGGRAMESMSGAEIQEIVRLYLRASAQLTEVRSRFQDPSLQAYLNSLVSRAHGAVYSAKPRTVRGFARLFAVRYPEALRRTLPYILVAAAILVVVVVTSWAWVASSPTAQAGILPPGAREAIRRSGGRAATLGPPPGLATLILFNNVQVAFLAFALGITFGIGTIVVVVRNALLLGVLAGAFQAVGNAGRFWLLILPHGILELIAICIAAGAGLRMGWALIDPGERSRGRALREEAAEAVVVVIGVIPAFIVAALIEAFITGTAVPDVVEIGIGIAASLGYLVVMIALLRRAGRFATAAQRS
jgi:uncharacterized membrane protein SpoIIM required for sporulation